MAAAVVLAVVISNPVLIVPAGGGPYLLLFFQGVFIALYLTQCQSSVDDSKWEKLSFGVIVQSLLMNRKEQTIICSLLVVLTEKPEVRLIYG